MTLPAGPAWDYPQPFLQQLCPQPADIDGLNHTNNAVYVRWCEQIGWAHSEALGLSLADYQRLDRAMAIRRGTYDYLLPTLEGEALILATWLVGGDGKLSMERRFQLVRNSDQATVLRGHWDLVCIDIASGRPRRMPPEFIAAYVPHIVPQIVPQVVPHIVPQIAPQIVPQIVPQVVPHIVPQIAPQIAPQIVPQIVPQIAPHIVPQIAPQIVPQVVPRVVPQVVPQIVPQQG